VARKRGHGAVEREEGRGELKEGKNGRVEKEGKRYWTLPPTLCKNSCGRPCWLVDQVDRA